ncbi:MAG: competence/damage-inducible protein A, partial [Bacteroidales bacterium]|nr:competence/damage-inducible protein A [Bacteroidales bacterium]
MIQASICTIGDEILIGQVVDTNSSHLAVALEEAGIRVTRMLSIGDDRAEILNNLHHELTVNDIVITTGGLGPTKDDITKGVLAELSGSTGLVEHAGQLAIIQEILHSRGLDMLASNRAQALVPDGCEVIENRLGTAPIMVFRFP